MSYWQVHERGSEGGVWKLTQRDKLTLGRNKGNNVVFSSQTVEGNHAVVEWSGRQEAFLIRDLGSVNGTYVNNQPLRGGVAVLCHGDSLRFGYDKSRVFRVEEVYQPCESSPSRQPSSVTTQTSPQTPSSTTTTPTAGVTTAAPGVVTPVSTQQIPLPYAVANGVHHGAAGGNVVPQAPVSGVQYISVPPGHPHSQMVYQMQSPMQQVPYILAQSPLQFGYPPPSPPVTPQVLMPSLPPPSPPISVAPPVIMSPLPPISPLTPQNHSPAQPVLTTPTSLLTTPTSDHHLTVEDIESEESGEKALRSDGRRSVELSQSPLLSTTSSLYGRPSWWGEGQGEETASLEFEIAKPGSQILRDLDSPRSQQEEEGSGGTGSSKGVRLSAKDELRMQAITNSIAQERDSSWVIDFGGGAKTKPTRPHHRPRSADPSPSRTATVRDVSPAARGSRRSISPAARRMTVSTTSPSHSPTHGTHISKKTEAQSARKKETEATLSAKKPPSGSLGRSKTVRGSPRVQRSDQRRRSLEGLKTDPKVPLQRSSKVQSSQPSSERGAKASGKPPEGGRQNETYVKGSEGGNGNETQGQNGNETYVTGGNESQSSVSDRSGEVVVTSDPKDPSPGERPSSARKQWTNEQPQAPDSLMLASIEARMRRLSKMAHSVAIHVSSLKKGLLEVGGVTIQGHASFEPFCTSPTAGSTPEQNLPEWKFFNKEVDSIFRSVRATERWLKDIDNTVNSVQPMGGAQSGGGGVKEEVDHAQQEVDSEGEYFQDSIDDLSCLSEDTHSLS